MKIFLILLFTLLTFSLLLFKNKRTKSTMLFTLAIGGAVNANFFNANVCPIMIFNIPFGMDSIIYTLFIFCIIIGMIDFDKKFAISLVVSTSLAILFSAVVQFISLVASIGYTNQFLIELLLFLVSIVATILAVFVMLKIMQILINKNFNKYLIITISILLATIINSAVYYGLSMAIIGVPSNFLPIFLASVIGKLFTLIISLITYYIMQKMNKTNQDSETPKN